MINIKVPTDCNTSMNYYHKSSGTRGEMESHLVMSSGPILGCEFLEGKDHRCFIYSAQNILPMYRGIIQEKELGSWYLKNPINYFC